MFRRVAGFISYNIQIRTLAEIFSNAQPNAQDRPLNIFYRSKSLINFQHALDHIYDNVISDPELVYSLPKLLKEVNKLPDPSLHIKLFSLKILPHLEQNQMLKSTYINSIKDHCDNLSINDVYKILENLTILLKQDEKSDIFNRFQDEQLVQVFTKVLNTFSQNLPFFENNVKYSMLVLSKSLKIYNQEFTQHIKSIFIHQFRQFSVLHILTILSYLSDTRTFPHNFFSEMKNKWLDIIAPTPILLDKNESSLLKLLEIFSKERLFYCEKIIERSYDLILRNIDDLDGTDLIRALYYYSKTPYEDREIVREIIVRLSKKIEEVTSPQMNLLLIALGNLEFSDLQFITEIGKNQHFFDSISVESENSQNKQYFLNLKQLVTNIKQQ